MRFWRPKSKPNVRVEISGAYIPSSVLEQGLKDVLKKGRKRRPRFRRERGLGTGGQPVVCVRCGSPLQRGRRLLKRCESCGRVHFLLGLRRRPMTLSDLVVAVLIAIFLILLVAALTVDALHVLWIWLPG